MRREHRHHRRSRKFRPVNEYSLYRNRIYLLNTLRAAQQNRTVRKELLEWFRRNEDELEIMDAFLMQEYNKTIKEQSPRLFMTESLSSEDPAQRKAAETQFINASVKTLEQKTREPHGPAICTTFLGSEPGQRIAQPDGAAPPPICLHHEPVGHHRPGSRTPLCISRRVLLPGSTAHQPRLRVVLQQHSTALCTRTDQTHPRRLCQRARTSRDTGLPERPRAHRARPRRRMPHKTRRYLRRLLTP